MVAKTLSAISVLLLTACGTGSQFNWEESDRSKLIRLAIRENIGPIKACYESELKGDASFSGDLRIEWDIDDQGVAKNARRLNGSILKSDFVECVTKQVEAIKFAPSDPGNIVTVSYPFKFLK